MRNRALAQSLLAALLSVTCFAVARAQEGNTEKSVVPMKGGYYVGFTTTTGPGKAGSDGWSMTFAEASSASNTVRRVFVDSGGSLFFGYAINIEPLPASKQFRVSVRPLGPEDEQELRARKSFQSRQLHPNYNAASLSRASEPQVIEDGDSFALDVLVNPRTGDKITDYVTVSANESRVNVAAKEELPPRDFTLADVEMKMINYQLLINGELVAGGKRSGACAGPVIWFHLPGRGRFIFSLTPHDGYDFKRSGTIERNRIKFELGGESYEWVSDVPVVSASGHWNLYVLHDPNYVPDSFLMGVSGAAAKGENRQPSRLDQIVESYPGRKSSGGSGFGRQPTAKKQEEPDNSPGPRLIIGAASRVENLLPKN